MFWPPYLCKYGGLIHVQIQVENNFKNLFFWVIRNKKADFGGYTPMKHTSFFFYFL